MTIWETSPPPHRPRNPTREQQAWFALEVLDREQFVAFLRAVRDTTGCIAVRLANEALDEGKTVDQLFFTGEQYGFILDVAPTTEYAFVHGPKPSIRELEVLRINFGCLADGLAGDGGFWTVTLADDGTLNEVGDQKGQWRA